MRDNRPVAMSSASAVKLSSITVQCCMRDNRPISVSSASGAAYRCRSDCVDQVFVGYLCTYSFQVFTWAR